MPKNSASRLDLGHLHGHDQGDRFVVAGQGRFFPPANPGRQVDAAAGDVAGRRRSRIEMLADNRPIGRMLEQLGGPAEIGGVVAAKGKSRRR